MSKPKVAPEQQDPLVDLIMGMQRRIAELDEVINLQDNRLSEQEEDVLMLKRGFVTMRKMVETLADEQGYKIKTTAQGGGKTVLSWEKRSPLVRL